MSTQEDLDQQLWDYVFGLLGPCEARALEDRITSEHDVARAYAEVRQRADMLGTAARIDISPVELVRPALTDLPVTCVARSQSVSGGSASWNGRALSWLLASSALVMFGLIGYGWKRQTQMHDTTAIAAVRDNLARDYVRVSVAGPTKLQAGVNNYYAIRTENLQGKGVSSEICYEVKDTDGNVLQSSMMRLSEDGTGQLGLDGTLVATKARLSLWCEDQKEEPVALEIERAEPKVRTLLTTNQVRYRAGDVVYYSSFVRPGLTKYGEAEEARWKDHLDSQGGATSQQVDDLQEFRKEAAPSLTMFSVASGAVELPKNAPAGLYMLTTLDDQGKQVSPPVRFEIVDSNADWDADFVQLNQSVAPGEPIVASMYAKTPAGAPMEGVTVKLQAFVNGRAIEMPAQPTASKTAENGHVEVRLPVPADVAEGLADLTFTFEKDKQQLKLSRSVAIRKDAKPASKDVALGYDVRVYSDGGTLIAGVPNKFYFRARDTNGIPATLGATIVNGKDERVAEASTTKYGLGTVEFIPTAVDRYYLKTNDVRTPLPAVTSGGLKLTSGAPVVAAGAPLSLEVVTTHPSAQLMVAALCEGVTVGQSFCEFDRKAPAGEAVTQRFDLPVASEASGLIHVTLYDVKVSPPAAVAKQYVYRQPANFWNVQCEPVADKQENGQQKWKIEVRDETGRAAPAVLGVSVVEDNVAPGTMPPADAADYAWYFNHADFAADDQYAGKQTDEKLTQLSAQYGIRPLAANQAGMSFGVNKFTRNFGFNGVIPSDEYYADLYHSYSIEKTTALGVEPSGEVPASAPPAVKDNLEVVKAAYERSLAAWRDTQQQRSQTIAIGIYAVSIAIMLGVGMLFLLRVARRPLAWLPQMAAAVAGLVVGGIWINQPLTVTGRVTAQAIANYDGIEVASLSDETKTNSSREKGKEATENKLHEGLLTAPKTESRPANGASVDRPIDQPAAQLTDPASSMTESLWRRQDLAFRHWSMERGATVAWGKPTLHFGTTRYRRLLEDEMSDNLAARPELESLDTVRPLALSVAPRFAVVQPVDGTLALGRAVELRILNRGVNFNVPQQENPPSVATELAKQRGGESGQAAPSGSTLYWNPYLPTDEQGKAEFRFAVPAGKTKYRMTVYAHGEGRWGMHQRMLGDYDMTK